jgi:glutamate synthase (NADPH/NADH) small chain
MKKEPVGIGRLERFVADYHNANVKTKVEVPALNGHKVAVIGSGPSGLTCAGDLAKKGFKVSIFEALHTAGCVLVYGIPEFRLPKSIVQKEIDNLKALGVDVETNIVIGKTLTIDELFEDGYEAIYIGSGAGLPRFMNIPGEGLKGVFSANEFLTRINLMKAYTGKTDTPIEKGKKAIVVGGGNVAMDAARCARRLGAEVHIVYRRTEAELPARKEEVEHAMEEGIIFDFLTNPTQILGDDKGNVNGVEVISMELGEPDASGRRRPVEVKDSEHVIDADVVIMALGTSPNPLIKSTTEGLETNPHGCIIADENGQTSLKHIYAGGDAVTGAATVILAMGAGKKAAAAISKDLLGE